MGAAAARRASVREGDDVSYTITVRNVGAETARDVLLTLDFGSNQALQGVDCRASSGAACPLQTGAQMVLPSLAAGGQLVFTVPVTLALGTAPAGAGASITARAGADARAANNSASVSVAATERSWVRLQSDGNDPVGGGSTFTYTRSSAQLAVTANGNLLTIAVRGDQTWEGQFQLPNSATQLQVGTYPSLTRYPNHAPAVGGLSWTGTSSVCFQVRGTLSVTRAIYVAGVLSELDLSFEQTCDGATGALRGALRWRAGDTTQPPGPVNPPPASLWAPAPGVTPASGDYVYLESEAGDFIGGGGTYSFTRANALLSIAMSGARLQIGVAAGQVGFNGSFLPMNTVMALQPGYYPNLQYPVINPVRGSLEVSGNGRGCNRTQGWVAIDRVSFNAGQLSELELRFEQRCDGATAALRGKLRLTGNDTTVPPGPVQPPPAGLWTPPAGAVPPTGDFIYLQSDASDFIGRGRTHSYSRANARLLFMSSPGLFSVSIDGDEWWNGDFKAMSTLTRLAPGYYGDLQRYPFHNQVKGGLSWFGQSRACNQLSGWFVVDSASYSGDTLTAITLRFEQRCENGAAALRGLVRMTVGDATTPPGPVNPPPANLWAPAPGATPASGDYVYLESDSTDFIAQGRSYTYTRANAQLRVQRDGRPAAPAARVLRRPAAVPVQQPGQGRAGLGRRGSRLQHAGRLVRGRQRQLQRQHAHRDRTALLADLRRRGRCAARQGATDAKRHDAAAGAGQSAAGRPVVAARRCAAAVRQCGLPAESARRLHRAGPHLAAHRRHVPPHGDGQWCGAYGRHQRRYVLARRVSADELADADGAWLLRRSAALAVPQPGQGRPELVGKRCWLQCLERLVRCRRRDVRQRRTGVDHAALRAALRSWTERVARGDPLGALRVG